MGTTTNVTNAQPDPLHGITLAALLTTLVARYGWDELAQRIDIRCFKSNPDIKSSLTFLRRTPWARTQVEALYLQSLKSPPAASGSQP
jgi:uncharacterized protein (DUF2132 family)